MSKFYLNWIEEKVEKSGQQLLAKPSHETPEIIIEDNLKQKDKEKNVTLNAESDMSPFEEQPSKEMNETDQELQQLINELEEDEKKLENKTPLHEIPLETRYPFEYASGKYSVATIAD